MAIIKRLSRPLLARMATQQRVVPRVARSSRINSITEALEVALRPQAKTQQVRMPGSPLTAINKTIQLEPKAARVLAAYHLTGLQAVPTRRTIERSQQVQKRRVTATTRRSRLVITFSVSSVCHSRSPADLRQLTLAEDSRSSWRFSFYLPSQY